MLPFRFYRSRQCLYLSFKLWLSLISKTYKDFYDDVRLTSNYIANLYNNKHIFYLCMYPLN